MYRIAALGVVLLACSSSRPVEPSHGTLSMGAPFVRGWDMYRGPVSQGEVDLALVATAMERRLGELERCYEGRLAENPKLAGTISIHGNIAESGKVTDACIIEDTVGDEAVTACVNALVLAGEFPAPRGGSVDVSFPFAFTPRPMLTARR